MIERARRGDLNADTILCEVYGTGESVCGALRKSLKDSNIQVLRVLISPRFPATASGSC